MSEDVWGAAENAKPPSSTFFGEVQLDVWFCALIKGTGKVPFDSGQHKPEQKRTAIDITITPLVSRGVTWVLERKLIAESRQWAGMVLPSIRALGASPKQLNGKYVQYEMKPTGRTWTGTDGAEKTETVPVFAAMFGTEDECEAAADAFYTAPAETGNGNGAQDGAEKATAAKFLPALWAQSKGDMTGFGNLISGNPLTNKFFDLSSPEVLAVIS